MNRELYTEDGNICIYNIKERIGSGGDGKIYLLNNGNCLKIFRSPHFECARNIINIISDLNIDGMYRIYNLLYNDKKEFVGYEMKYYKKGDIDILTMPMDYTIDNLIKLYNLADIFGEYNIVMHDLLCINIILDNNGITVIDADGYYFDKHGTKSHNKSIVNSLFKDLYHKSLEYNHNIVTTETTKNVENLFIGGNVDCVYKKLKKYKYPVDYLRKNNNNVL